MKVPETSRVLAPDEALGMPDLTRPLDQFELELGDPDYAANSAMQSLGSLSVTDRRNFYFLTLLYYAQGIPVGLTFGSIPFLLKERLSYSEIGIFTFASFPYSLKILWSPVVDAFYIPKFGRRQSWIVPIQIFSFILLLVLSKHVAYYIENAETKLVALTIMFGTLVFACATQDIAVDGWALTLLSKPALPYASTAQTIGINGGYFTSFTVFLALSSPEFANKYFRKTPIPDVGLVTLSGYLQWCAFVYFIATVAVIFLKHRDPVPSRLDQGQSVIAIYKSMISVLKLKNMRSLTMVHLLGKLAFQAAEAVTNLKLLEKGLSKEDLALVVLIDFPFEVIFGYYAARWSSGPQTLRPWLIAYVLRLIFASVSMSQVYFFPESGVSNWFLTYVIFVHTLGSFLATVQFVSITAFHTKIADPEIGGTYMTILNTLCNLGGQWPRVIVLAGVDWFTKAYCDVNGERCVTMEEKAACSALNGTCIVVRDGYYFMNFVCLGLGVFLFTTFIQKTMRRLQSLPTSAWRY